MRRETGGGREQSEHLKHIYNDSFELMSTNYGNNAIKCDKYFYLLPVAGKQMLSL